MRRILLVLFPLLICSGCSTYTASQMALATQARKGIARWSAREAARDDEVKQAWAAKRKALDQAFDADARLQTNPSADWIIEAREAYAIGLDAIGQSESAALAANYTAKRDAAATDAALTQLQWLFSIQLGVETFFEKGGKP
jgi:uncharacterized protein YceK